MVINIAKTYEPHIFQYYQNSPEGLGYTRQAASKRVKSLAKQADITLPEHPRLEGNRSHNIRYKRLQRSGTLPCCGLD